MHRNGDSSMNRRVSGLTWSAILLTTTSEGMRITSRSSASALIVRMRARYRPAAAADPTRARIEAWRTTGRT